MKKSVTVSLSLAAACGAILLAGCGLAETGAVAAAEGESAVQQVEEAKKMEAKVEQGIDDAQQAAADARAKAEADSQ